MEDNNTLNDIMAFIKDVLAPLIYVAVPTICGIIYKIRLKTREEKNKIDKQRKKDSEEKYNVWEHEESRNIIKSIKDQCNFYKDRSHCDLVMYMQLENGTVATSKLQNMFLTCLAEDDRYGAIPKLIKKLQRVPYSEVSHWMHKIEENIEDESFVLETPEWKNCPSESYEIEGMKYIKSTLTAPIYSPNRLLLGVVIYIYSNPFFNDKKEEELQHLRKFQASVESILVTYHEHRKMKKKELGLEEE